MKARQRRVNGNDVSIISYAILTLTCPALGRCVLSFETPLRSARRNVRKCLDLGFEPSVIGHPAAVHQLGRSADVRARVGGQEDDRAGDLGRLRPALQRRLVGVSIPPCLLYTSDAA